MGIFPEQLRLLQNLEHSWLFSDLHFKRELQCWFMEKLLKQQKDGYHMSLYGKALAYAVVNLNRMFISVHQSRFFFSSWIYSLMPIQVQILLYFFKLSLIICYWVIHSFNEHVIGTSGVPDFWNSEVSGTKCL